MKRQILNTLLGLALISLGAGAAAIGVQVAFYLQQNYVFDTKNFIAVCATVIILYLANKIGNMLTGVKNE
jgi:hypothetical protein